MLTIGLVKNPLLSFCILTLLTAVLPWCTHADIVNLTTGEKVEGKISRETDTELTLEIKVSASINDERVIKKTEIANIEKQSSEDIAFQEIKKLKLNPQTSLKPEIYSRFIGNLEAFKKSYPTSPRLQNINELITAFHDEKKRVDAGELKFQGQWLSAPEVAKRRIQIEGMLLFDTMKNQVNNLDLAGSLNSFDAIEKKYSNSRVYPDAIELAVQVLNNLQRQVNERVKINAYNDQQFKRSLELAKIEDVEKLKTARKREESMAINAIDQARKSGAKWSPFIPRNTESINSFQGLIPTELTRLQALPVQKMHASVGLTDDAQAALNSGKSQDAIAFITQALLAWPLNEDAIRLKKQIDNDKPKPTPTPTPANTVKKEVATPTPVSRPVEDTEKPFYMTVNGAISITAAAILLIGGLTLNGRLKKSKTPKKKAK